jgi:predicted ATPase/transcriptional regulator with XRE-family HTH domain
MDDELSFGRWVKVRRVALGLTQAKLADRMGYSTVTIRKIESDDLRPSRQIAEKLAEVLAIAPDEHSDFIRHARGEAGTEHGHRTHPKVTPHPSILPQTGSLPLFLREQSVAVTPPPVFVGRDRELAELTAALQTARSGKGQILFVIGGAGRGKTMLVQEFARQAQSADPELLIVSGYGNVHTGIGDPYLPFREALTMLTGEVEAKWAGGLVTADHARRLWEAMPLTIAAVVEHAPDLVDSFVPSKGLRERAATFNRADAKWFEQLVTLTSADASAKLEQQRIFVQYTAALTAIARQRPLLLILEDLHWVDAASSSLLFYLSRKVSQSRILIVGTYRPDELALNRGDIQHPLAGILSELKRWHGDIWLDLGELAPIEGRHFVEAYLDTQPNRLGAAFREALFRRTGGHALFTVELLREMQERGDLRKDADGQWIEGPAVDWNKLPTKVEGVIEKRIQRLEKDLQSILSIASIEGETFTAEVVARVQQLNERGLIQQLSRELDRRHRLVTAQILTWLGQQRLSLFRFRHQLFQHYLYTNLAEIERTYLHEAVGSVLETIYGEQTEQVAVQLAHHFEQAGLRSKAVHYLLQAGQQAGRLSANQEAIAHLSKGLALLETLPDSAERAQTEIELQIALGNALMATKGYAAAEVEQTYNRARELYQQVYAGETSHIFPILYGQIAYRLIRGEHQTAHQLAVEFLDLAQRRQDPVIIVAHRVVGWRFCMGELLAARPHFEQIAALYNPEQHRALTFRYGQEPGQAGLSAGAVVLWLLGYPEQAGRWSHQAVMLAQEASHSHSLVFSLVFRSITHQFCQEMAVAKERAEEAIAVCAQQGFANWLAWGMILRGWALVKMGQGEAGPAQIDQGLAAARATGTEFFRTYFLALLADTYQTVGQPEAGLAVLAEALAHVEKTEERFWEAEVYRLKGKLLLMHSGGKERARVDLLADVESDFQRAIDIARRQQAKSLELRATTSLCRLWQAQGKRAEGHALLAEIYGWFTEGFDTADLIEAKTLLEALK